MTGRRGARASACAPVGAWRANSGFGVTPTAAAQLVDLDRRAVAAVGVLALVLGVERAATASSSDSAAGSTGTASERHWPR